MINDDDDDDDDDDDHDDDDVAARFLSPTMVGGNGSDDGCKV